MKDLKVFSHGTKATFTYQMDFGEGDVMLVQEEAKYGLDSNGSLVEHRIMREYRDGKEVAPRLQSDRITFVEATFWVRSDEKATVRVTEARGIVTQKADNGRDVEYRLDSSMTGTLLLVQIWHGPGGSQSELLTVETFKDQVLRGLYVRDLSKTDMSEAENMKRDAEEAADEAGR